MTKMNKKIIFSIALILIIIFIMSTSILAVNTDFYEPTVETIDQTFLQRAGVALGWIQYIGIITSVVALSIIGIKYLFSSVEEKAEYKKTMIPYVIGCFLIGAISVIIGLIANVTSS